MSLGFECISREKVRPKPPRPLRGLPPPLIYPLTHVPLKSAIYMASLHFFSEVYDFFGWFINLVFGNLNLLKMLFEGFSGKH